MPNGENGDNVTGKKRGFRIESTVPSKEEHALIVKAAAHKNMSLSQFVVYACLREARGDRTLDLLEDVVERLESGIHTQNILVERQEHMIVTQNESAERQRNILKCQYEALTRLNNLISPVETTNQYVEEGLSIIQKINSYVEDLKCMVEDVKGDVNKIDKD